MKGTITRPCVRVATDAGRCGGFALWFGALALAASGQALALSVGDTVLASPLSLEGRFEVCQIETDLTAQGAWGIRCQSGTWVVGVGWVKAAPPGTVFADARGAGPGAVTPASSPSTPAAAAASPAPEQLPAAPAPAATAARPAPSPAPAAAPANNGGAFLPGPDQRAIPAGLYLAPIGGSLEVLQILGGRVALAPRRLLAASEFTPANAADLGALVIEGDELRVTWLDGRQRTGRFSFDGKCLSWGYIYCRVTPFDRAAVLEGRYVGSASAGAGTVSRTVWFEFGPGQRYASARTGAIGAPAGTSGAAAASTAEQGRYRIEGFTLELMPDDGAARSVLAFPYEVYGPQDPIYIDGGFLRRQ